MLTKVYDETLEEDTYYSDFVRLHENGIPYIHYERCMCSQAENGSGASSHWANNWCFLYKDLDKKHDDLKNESRVTRLTSCACHCGRIRSEYGFSHERTDECVTHELERDRMANMLNKHWYDTHCEHNVEYTRGTCNKCAEKAYTKKVMESIVE